jgi:hypothetical protein
MFSLAANASCFFNPEPASWSPRPCNFGRCAIPYIHSEHLNTGATHIPCCPGQPSGDFIAGFFTVKSSTNRVRGATASGYVGAVCKAHGVSERSKPASRE